MSVCFVWGVEGMYTNLSICDYMSVCVFKQPWHISTCACVAGVCVCECVGSDPSPEKNRITYSGSQLPSRTCVYVCVSFKNVWASH
jgi:hypothetical protein